MVKIMLFKLHCIIKRVPNLNIYLNTVIYEQLYVRDENKKVN